MPVRKDFETYDDFREALRDYFAGQALTGFMDRIACDSETSWEDGAENCYNAADAMIAQRGRA